MKFLLEKIPGRYVMQKLIGAIIVILMVGAIAISISGGGALPPEMELLFSEEIPRNQVRNSSKWGEIEVQVSDGYSEVYEYSLEGEVFFLFRVLDNHAQLCFKENRNSEMSCQEVTMEGNFSLGGYARISFRGEKVYINRFNNIGE